MPSVSVHLGVLAIAKDPARPDLAAIDAVAVRAAAAGHRVMARQAVSDTEAAIRSQLARWFDDKEIDVVIVLSGDSKMIATTMAPLVTHVLPGMGSTQAAQCGSTFVFVVPTAIPTAMDRLILPQLDAATTPRNLLALLPRLHAKPAPSGDAVPQAVPVEKTVGGSGLPARLPAEMRPKPRTGANVISRGRPPVADPPTKPIDVARLERQIAKSTTPSHDDVTRPAIALGLPPLPPGAVAEPDEVDDDLLDSDDDHTATDTVAVQPAPPLPPAGPRSRPPTGQQRTQLPSVVKRPSTTATPTGGVPAAPSRESRPFSFSTPVSGRTPGSASPPMRSGGTPPREPTTTGTAAYPTRDAKSTGVRSSPPPAPPREPTSSGTPAYPARDPKSGGIRSAPPPPPAVTPPREPTASGTPAYPARSSSGTSPPPIPTAAKTSSGSPAYSAKPPTPPKAAPEDDAEADAKLLADAKAAADARDAAAAKLVAEAREVVARAQAAAQAEADARDAADAKLLADAKAAAEARDAAEQAEADAKLLADAKAAAEARDAAEHAEDDDAKLLAEAKAAADARDAAAQAEEDAKLLADAKRAAEARDAAAANAKSAEPPPVAPARVPQATPPAALPIAARVRQPTPPPPLPVVPAATDEDLPRGAFSYPVQPRKNKLVLKVLAAAAFTVLGFFAVVYFLDRDKTPSTKVATVTPPVPADAPAAVAVADAAAVLPTGSATTEPDIEMDTGDPPPATGSAGKGSAAKATAPPPTGPRPRPVPPAPRSPTGPVTPPATGTTTAATPPPPPPDEPDVADMCDEANCVLSDYDRPCCEKYKPKGPVLSQRVGGVPQTLDRSMVKSGVDGIKPRVIACGEKSGVKGTVKIAVAVSAEGAVTSADVEDSPDAALGTCVAGALRAAKFKKSVEGGSFTYPFVF